MLAKNNSRCFRYSDEILEILLAQEGNGLNQKFENLVLICNKKLPLVQKSLKMCEADLQKVKEQRDDLFRQISDLRSLLRQKEILEMNLESLQEAISVFADNFVSQN